MSAWRIRCFSASLVLGLILAATVVPAEQSSYTESFTSTQYKDIVHTTADWDTLLGQVNRGFFALTKVGDYDTPVAAFRVTVAGDLAFVADAGGGLLVMDVSDVTAPSLVSTYPTVNGIVDVAVSGDLLVVADGAAGIDVVDILDPSDPVRLGYYNTPGNAQGIVVSGDYAFVADSDSGLLILDIEDPSNPTHLGSYDTPDRAYGVAVSGDYALVADGASGLQVIDISDPTNPQLLGTYSTPTWAEDVVVSGDRAFVADRNFGLLVIDISDPSSPTLIGDYDTPGQALGVTVSGDYAYVADGAVGGLQVIDVKDPANLEVVSSYNTFGTTYGVTVSGIHAFLADGFSGLVIMEIAEQVGPTPLAALGTSDKAIGLTVAGDYVFVADSDSGLQVIDVSDPTTPKRVGGYDTPDRASGVAVSGNVAFVADYAAGIHAMDVSNPTTPILLDTYNTPDSARDVVAAGDYAFVADGNAGLLVIGISDPSNLSLLGSYDTPGRALRVKVAGDYAFVADYSSGLQVLDISNPASPAPIGSYATVGTARDVAVSGDYALVATSGSGFVILSVSDPSNPTLLGTYNTTGFSYGVAIEGNYAFVADGPSGLHVVDLADPTSPALLGTYDTPDQALSVTIDGDHAYVADYNTGLLVSRVFLRERDRVRSLPVSAPGDSILRARLTTTQQDSVRWELSADAGMNWQSILPDARWNAVAVPGVDLLWRLELVSDGGYPIVSDLEIGWLTATASILSIVDAPDDQGGWVQVQFRRSGLDFLDEATLPVTDYEIWRRVDGAASAAEATESHQRETYTQLGPGTASSSFPPGTWELVSTLPASQQDTYTEAAPTVADSSLLGINYAVFVVRARTSTPSVWYVSDPDSGYSVYDGAMVTNTADSGVGSLRQAILDANATPGYDVIDFDIPGDGPHVIQPATPLPAMTDADLIDGYTQPGASPNTLDRYTGGNAVIKIWLDGSATPPGTSGIVLAAQSSAVRGLAIGNFTDAGVRISADGCMVRGNYIGTDTTGAVAAPNGTGVIVEAGYINGYIGGFPADRNLISGNLGAGVEIAGAYSIEGNFIGTDPSGNVALPNQGAAVAVVAGSGVNVGNSYGDATNVVCYAGPGGIVVTGATTVCEILNNWVWTESSAGQGIDLGGDGVTPNDAGDSDSGPNSLLNYPEITMVTTSNGGSQTQIEGQLVGGVPAIRTYRLQFFASPVSSPRQGRLPLGGDPPFEVTTDANGFAAFSHTVSGYNPPGGWWLTATASYDGSTSEYSVPFPIVNTPVGVGVGVDIQSGTGEDAWVEFDSVTVAGATSLTSSAVGPDLPAGFQINDPQTYYEITTTATYMDSITVCIHYDEASLQGSETEIRLMHYDTLLAEPEWVDITSSLHPDENYVCGRTAHLSPFIMGVTTATGVDYRSVVPAAFALHPNVPNPFNPTTTIAFDVPEGGGRVTLAVYDVTGRLVRSLVDGELSPGYKTVRWDGRSNSGRMSVSGVYFYRLAANGFSITRKMVLLK